LRLRGLQARALDVTDEGAVARLIEEIHTDHGGVDVLVNNAGFGSSSPLEQVVLSDLRSIFETNVVAMLHLSQAVLPGMRARGAGTIVNIGSICWTVPHSRCRRLPHQQVQRRSSLRSSGPKYGSSVYASC
jgi:short-subunit dehydrogenase